MRPGLTVGSMFSVTALRSETYGSPLSRQVYNSTIIYPLQLKPGCLTHTRPPALQRSQLLHDTLSSHTEAASVCVCVVQFSCVSEL